jgi:hypothetical protein
VRQLEQADIFSGDEFKHGVGVAARRNIKTKSEKVQHVSCALLAFGFTLSRHHFFCSFALTWGALSAGNTLMWKPPASLQLGWDFPFRPKMMLRSWRASGESPPSSA